MSATSKARFEFLHAGATSLRSCLERFPPCGCPSFSPSAPFFKRAALTQSRPRPLFHPPSYPTAAFGFIEITRKIMDCMRLGQWLNDEVINFYLGLLQEREIAAGRVLPDKRVQPRVHFHNTFFYNKLFADSQKYGYKNVQRWTSEKKLGYSILDCDLVLVPVHQARTPRFRQHSPAPLPPLGVWCAADVCCWLLLPRSPSD